MTTVIIGAKNPDQLDDNIKAVDVVLSAEELQKLDEVPGYPESVLSFSTSQSYSGSVTSTQQLHYAEQPQSHSTFSAQQLLHQQSEIDTSFLQCPLFQT